MANKNYVVGRFAFKTDQGKVRITNEDRVNGLLNSKGNVFLIVCDGMGGQNKGEVASTIAVTRLTNAFKTRRPFLTTFGAISWLKKEIRSVNYEIFSMAENNEIYHGMGTTLTCALILNNAIITAQIGDSRCYSLLNHKFEQISEDQTYVAYLYRIGQITKEEMKTHPKRHVLMNALGSYPSVNVDVKVFPYNHQSLLLCSDGLYNNVPDNDIASIIKGDDTTEQKVNELVTLANSNGGSDNIAVILWEANQ